MKSDELKESASSDINPEGYFPFVHFIAKRFYGRGFDSEELFQAGIIGLLEAAKRFDSSRNIAFTSFAFSYIEHSIRQALRECFLYSRYNNYVELNETDERRDLAENLLGDSNGCVNNLMDRIEINESVKSLNLTEKQIIQLRYFKDLTQTHTAQLMHMSQSSVSKKEKEALMKIKVHLTMHDLCE